MSKNDFFNTLNTNEELIWPWFLNRAEIYVSEVDYRGVLGTLYPPRNLFPPSLLNTTFQALHLSSRSRENNLLIPLSSLSTPEIWLSECDSVDKPECIQRKRVQKKSLKQFSGNFFADFWMDGKNDLRIQKVRNISFAFVPFFRPSLVKGIVSVCKRTMDINKP